MNRLLLILTILSGLLITACNRTPETAEKQEETPPASAAVETQGMMPGSEAFKPGNAAASEDAQWTFQKAATLVTLGNYDEALGYINQYIAKEPNDGNGFFAKGYIYSLKKEYGLALPEYKEALRLNAAHTYARMYKGEAHMYLGQQPEAFESFTRVIQAEPKNMYAYYNRGIVLSNLNKYKEAVNDFDVALAIDSTYAPAMNNRGNAKYLLGDLEGACKDWKKSMRKGNVASEKAYNHYCAGKGNTPAPQDRTGK